MYFRFDVCTPAYSGWSNGVSFSEGFCTTYPFAVSRLWSHPPYFRWRRECRLSGGVHETHSVDVTTDEFGPDNNTLDIVMATSDTF